MSMPSDSSRVFVYARVSTDDQTTDNQIREVASAGFDVKASRVVAETVSGSTCAAERPGFAKLIDRLEEGDVLVVTKLDRLGRNAIDVTGTVDRLAGIGVRVHCLALGGVDLTSAAGRMTMQVLGAVAEFERDLIVERTKAGLARARVEGVKIGRPAVTDDKQRAIILERLEAGQSVASLAKEFEVSRQTVMRIRDA